ncbi:MAG: tRNA preQ1(34) S-adenosylmethionine ribosyltransferase-isomerase QueA [Alphaproteobacteria bacterium]|nr:tRNA preQ1(34) S-adenosylmethionine ribosyltransferase-isomerase QueA [Alphaproteobacteria bacterium]
MRLDEFDFDLPRDRIAQQPARPRDSARLLAVGDGLEDRTVVDLPSLLRSGDLLVVNETRVMPVRLSGKRGDATVEVTLHTDTGDGRWLAFAKPGRRLRVGDRIVFADEFHADVAEKRPEGDVVLAFDMPAAAFVVALDRHGTMPLPPYIHRDSGGEPADRKNYQTMFAATDGAIAAPTAGLHFTPDLLARLKAAGIGCARITLHVGVGTFLPVKVEELSDHRMHSEYGVIDSNTAAAINAARAAGGRIVAVGTTCVRLLESAADEAGIVQPFEGTTDLFITPGWRFRGVDLMMTNFHLPRSTLFVLVSAFAGLARMQSSYRHAIESGYRFYSYGDACLLTPEAAPT